MPARAQRLLALLALVAPASVSAEDRPLLTETARTKRAGTLVLETGMDVMGSEPSYVTGIERNRWEGPLVRLVHSPSDNVELDLEWVVRVGVWDEAGRVVQASDWGDVTLRAKWRFRDAGRGGPTLGARFGVVLAQTAYHDDQFRPLGLGPNTLRGYAQALLSQPIGSVRLDANAGLMMFDEVLRAHEQRDFLLFGVAFAWRARRGLELVAEAAGRLGKDAPGADEVVEARLGARVGSGRLRGDVALRRGLTSAAGDWGGTLGLAWTLRR